MLSPHVQAQYILNQWHYWIYSPVIPPLHSYAGPLPGFTEPPILRRTESKNRWHSIRLVCPPTWLKTLQH